MYRIFIVEDDRVISKAIEKHIRSWGCEARCVEDFSDITGEFDRYAPHLVLMDIALPFFNGHYWCAEIRKRSQVPIIVISSASDNMNILMALNMGADDFIAKPFDLSVLTAKVQAMLRRSYDFSAQPPLPARGDAVLHVQEAALYVREEKIDLTKNELRILQILFENAGTCVSRDRIMERLWATDSFIDDNTLTVNVTRLRKKLEDAGLTDFILTKKGLGYMLA